LDVVTWVSENWLSAVSSQLELLRAF